MPANLTPEYLEAERRYKGSKTTAEKVAAVQEMLAAIPKHKGTEKMQADLKRRLSRLRAESQKKGGPKHAASASSVEREGAGQVVLAGPPNSGKSSLLARLTRATAVVADYPFTTRLPQPGMMRFENIQIQLVDLPPLDRTVMEPWVPQLIRSADAVALVVELDQADVLKQLTATLAVLEHHKINLGSEGESLPTDVVRKRAMLVGTKVDLTGTADGLQALRGRWHGRGHAVAVSSQTGENLETFRRAVFDLLEIVRVYTKVPGKKADLTAPFVLPCGATVGDLARRVHKDFVGQLKYARVWGGGKFDGQMVQRDYSFSDNDIIELHV